VDGNNIQFMIHDTKTNDNSEEFDVQKKLYRLAKEYPNRFEIQYAQSNIYDRLNIFIIDREKTAIIESNSQEKQETGSDDDKYDLLGLATYSNSQSTVSSYATIFDRLWLRAEFATSN
jgi:hypothetical protein